MALTNESFRDPRKLYKLRVKSSFWIPGRAEPTEVGEIIALPRSLAAEVVHSNKAVWAEEDESAAAKSPVKRAEPPQMPQPAPHAVSAKASAASK